ncbi:MULTISPECIES: HAD family phosphatase [unclassified Roseitalea]|uniref:HAD family hydrolase n=1 Tax=unclassified Roseitalea TaxID=2639107 RepID=UPI0027402668|nr:MULTISPECIES: HAD family phosphatase [unclassified Roseitalea]
MEKPIRHIVFDVGKVLIHYDPSLGFRDVISDEDERAWFLANVCTGAWNVEQDRGRPWAEAEAVLIAAHPEWEREIRAFRQNWRLMVPHALDDTVAILTALIEEGRDITFLTNFAADTFLEAQQMYPFLTAGRGVTVSGRVKLIKPEREIFALHTATFDLDPEATLFIDDSAVNVEGARAFGWQAVLFEGADKLRADLARHGVLPAD